MFGIAITGEAAGEAETVMAAGDEIEHAGAGDAAEHLGDDIARQFGRAEPPASPEPDRHRRIEVAARHMTNGISHCQHSQTKG